MQGESNNKKSFIYRYKSELALFTGVLVFVFGIMFGASHLFESESETTLATQQTLTANCYRVFVDDVDMGLVQDLDEGELLIKDAMTALTEEIGYDPEVTPKIRYYEEYSELEQFASSEALVVSIKDTMKASIDVIKEQACIMKIGDKFIIALDSEEDVEDVLQAAQSAYVTGDSEFAVELVTCEYNSLVETPVIVPIQEDLDPDRSFTASSGTAEDEDEIDGSEEASEEEEDEAVSSEEDASEEDDSEEATTEEEEALDPMYNGETVLVQFSEEVIVTEAFVNPSEIKTVDEAVELITKENEEPKIYNVVSGDCPSTIAEDNDMSLSQLYNLNPELAEKSYIQIGDELTVMVPEPELSVTTQEETVYIVAIDRGTTYVENPDKYVGSTVVLHNGYDGELQVTAIVAKVNGTEVSRTIIDEEVIEEPDNMIVEKGTMPLPAKGATGTYIPPLTSYVITSSYGYRWGGFHSGVDMAANTGTSIRAADGGVVTYAGWLGSYGYVVFIDHGDGVSTRYAHCNSIIVSEGQQVSQYQQIATVGSTGHSTGPHLHFEIRFDGITANPMDYLEY